MFANFALPDLARVSRRTVLCGLIFGVVGFVGCLALSAPLTGLGLCVGLGLGLFNFRLVQRSVAKVGAREDVDHKRPLAANTVGRLALISVLSIALLFLSFDLGLGVMVGLAAFQFFLLLNVASSMFKMGHGLSDDDSDAVLS
jgi:hypothetical protein